jgi:LytS/YehU family sensor histidine kinase
MVKEQQNEQLRRAELERAKAEAELTALKNQVDPHFMFNSLNTLTHLIKTDEDKALQFTLNLAEVYRYILMQKDHALVPLDDELEFTQKYTDLLHLRFGNSLIIQKDFNGTTAMDYLIPPTSVFVAFENAVKHNEVSERDVMQMNLSIQNGNLRITNTIREKKNKQPSPKIGLKNLNERFILITGRPIFAGLVENKFKVELPLSRLGNNRV